jgi:hypothetical protein
MLQRKITMALEGNRASDVADCVATYRRFSAALRQLRQRGNGCDGTHGEPCDIRSESCCRERDGLLTCLQAGGYTLDRAAYDAIEAGRYLPSDPGRFVAVLADCLHLDQHERRALLERLAVDILHAALGPELTAHIRAWYGLEQQSETEDREEK